MKRIIQKDIKKEDVILRKTAEDIPVSDISSEKIQTVLREMREALESQSDGVFIVAPMAYDNISNFSGKKQFIFINPRIIKTSSDKKLMEEGCLSVRPWYGKVRRASRATVEAYDADGEKFQMEGSGLIAQIFQHEIDHLEGILFTDKAKGLREIPLDDEDFE